MNLTGAPKQMGSMDLFERMRELLANSLNAKEAQYERLGEKEIDGRRAVGFRFDSPISTQAPRVVGAVRIESTGKLKPPAEK
ncbi:MAG: hypothetical protein WD063_18080 [Pirellulales bacterium]